MKIEDRVAMNRKIAEGYRNAYMRLEVKDGKKYDSWNFADDAIYCSPYWTNEEEWVMKDQPVPPLDCAALEAQAISLLYPDWKVVDCQMWPAEDGFVMKNKWVGTRKDGATKDYYSYTFARTNAQGQITRWETHVDENFGPFIESVIGVRGPFKDQLAYMNAVSAAIKRAGATPVV
jgi:hypothetical protein